MSEEHIDTTLEVDPGAEAIAEFGVLLARVDARKRAHRKALRGLLADVAAADGVASANQRKLFSIFAETSEDELDAAVDSPPAMRELERVAREQHEPMLAAALALAVSEGRVGADEHARLERAREAFHVSAERMEELFLQARLWYLDQEFQHLYAFGHPDADEYQTFLDTVEALGVPFSMAHALETQFLERRGWQDRRGPIEWHRAEHFGHHVIHHGPNAQVGARRLWG